MKKKLNLYDLPDLPADGPSFMAAYCLCRTPGLNQQNRCLTPLRAICQCDCHHKSDEDEA